MPSITSPELRRAIVRHLHLLQQEPDKLPANSQIMLLNVLSDPALSASRMASHFDVSRILETWKFRRKYNRDDRSGPRTDPGD